MLKQRQLGFVVEDFIQHYRRVARRCRNNLRPELRVLIRSPGVEGQPAPIAEVARQRRRIGGLYRDREALTVGGRKRAATEQTTQRKMMVMIDQFRRRGFKRLFAQIPVRRPEQLLIAEVRHPRHLRQAAIEQMFALITAPPLPVVAADPPMVEESAAELPCFPITQLTLF
jgi:hypothetical protein